MSEGIVICLACTKCGNVYGGKTDEELPPGAADRAAAAFICPRCAPQPVYGTVPRRRYHCTTCAAAIDSAWART